MILEIRAVAPFYKNGFVVGCETTREAVVIDPGDEADQLMGAVRDLDVDVRLILLTHAHIDHITGVAAIKDAYSAPVYLHRDDEFLYEAAVQQGAMFGFSVRQPPPVDAYYDGNRIVLWRVCRAGAPHSRALSRWSVSTGWTPRRKGQRSVRRRHALCWIDRTNRSPGRRLRRADAIDHASALSSW